MRVNADGPAKPNGKSSFILTSGDRTPKLPTIWFRSASAVSEFGHPPEASGLRVTAPKLLRAVPPPLTDPDGAGSHHRGTSVRTLRQHPPLRSSQHLGYF